MRAFEIVLLTTALGMQIAIAAPTPSDVLTTQSLGQEHSATVAADFTTKRGLLDNLASSFNKGLKGIGGNNNRKGGLGGLGGLGGGNRKGGNGDGGSGGKNGVNGGVNGGGAVSKAAIDQAQKAWQADTRMVSKFLSTAKDMSGQELQDAGVAATTAEKDELNHKAVLDRAFLKTNSTIKQADNVLAGQGNFQDVVDGLEDLGRKGASMSPQEVNQKIDKINKGRCTFVLPSIDKYFDAAGNQVGTGSNLKSIRPNADGC